MEDNAFGQLHWIVLDDTHFHSLSVLHMTLPILHNNNGDTIEHAVLVSLFTQYNDILVNTRIG